MCLNAFGPSATCGASANCWVAGHAAPPPRQMHCYRAVADPAVETDTANTDASTMDWAEDEARALQICKDIAAGKPFDNDAVSLSIKLLERAKPPVDQEALEQGEWRLCFTTGEKRRESIGIYSATGLSIPTEVLYTKQLFENGGRIENGVYLTDAFALRFVGKWSFKDRKLKFTFDTFSPKIFGADLSFGTDKQSGFFTCIYADKDTFVARGGNKGGLAIWTNKRSQA